MRQVVSASAAHVAAIRLLRHVGPPVFRGTTSCNGIFGDGGGGRESEAGGGGGGTVDDLDSIPALVEVPPSAYSRSRRRRRTRSSRSQ